jgi:hypothetical protein
LACAAVVFVLTTLRQIKTRLESKSLRPSEIGFILVFAMIVMVGMTPVPGGNFPQYLYELNYPGKKDDGQERPGKEESSQPLKLRGDSQ